MITTKSSMSALANVALCLIVLGLYWLPSILGFNFCRRRPDLITVVVVNALLGWTVVGWPSCSAGCCAATEPHGPWPAGLG